MNLNQNGRLVRFAYYFSGKIPSQTNLCRFFWRCVGMLVIHALYFGVWKPIDYIIIRGLGTPIAILLFGYVPRSEIKWRICEHDKNVLTPFDPASWVPKEYHFLPYKLFVSVVVVVVAIAAIAIAGYVLVYLMLIKGFFGRLVFGTFTGNVIFFALLTVIIGLITYNKLNKTEAWEMTHEFVKAKKRRVCPMITIQDQEAHV